MASKQAALVRAACLPISDHRASAFAKRSLA